MNHYFANASSLKPADPAKDSRTVLPLCANLYDPEITTEKARASDISTRVPFCKLRLPSGWETTPKLEARTEYLCPHALKKSAVGMLGCTEKGTGYVPSVSMDDMVIVQEI